MHASQECANCSSVRKCRRRDFSEQAWAALVVWGEAEQNVVDKAICEDCYVELRDILIERADEITKSSTENSKDSKSNVKKGKRSKVA